MKRITLVLALAVGLAAEASAQVGKLTWLIGPDGTLTMGNGTSEPVEFDTYTLSCQGGCLDPDDWFSIHDAVLADPIAVMDGLGPAALTFGETHDATSFHLSELNLAGSATLQPGDRWSFGSPFGGSLAQIRDWALGQQLGVSVAGNGVVIQSTIEIPEPSTMALGGLCVISLLGVRVMHRRSSP